MSLTIKPVGVDTSVSVHDSTVEPPELVCAEPREARERDTAERMQELPLAESSTLAPAAGHVVRGELRNAPLRAQASFEAYSLMDADSFSGPDDLRLKQLSRAAQRENTSLVQQLSNATAKQGIGAEVYGRAKTPFSTFGKLRETAGMVVGDIKDLSGARIDVKPQQPGFVDFYEAQGAAKTNLGESLQLKKDYIQQPNKWGYTGRIHSTAESASGLVHELQVGSKDLSDFIDGKLSTKGGDKISLHDATGYKGKIHGIELPTHLEGKYPELMSRITEANRAGKSVAELPELARDIDAYKKAVQEVLPARLAPPPALQLSTTAKLGRVATKGLGVFGVVGGAAEATQGARRIANGGDKIEGSAEVVAGSGSVVAGTAMVLGRIGLGSVTGGAVAVVDGAKDIYKGARDGDAEKIVVGTVKSGAGAAMIAGVATANPILLAGGAVAYGGAVVYENRRVIADGASRAWGWMRSKL